MVLDQLWHLVRPRRHRWAQSTIEQAVKGEEDNEAGGESNSESRGCTVEQARMTEQARTKEQARITETITAEDEMK
jgi:hypothetical protein